MILRKGKAIVLAPSPTLRRIQDYDLELKVYEGAAKKDVYNSPNFLGDCTKLQKNLNKAVKILQKIAADAEPLEDDKTIELAKLIDLIDTKQASISEWAVKFGYVEKKKGKRAKHG